jgi:hypothetical protein
MARRTTTKPAPAPAPEAPRENRYLRSARVIIETGEGVSAEELAMKAEMSAATAGHCLEAFKGCVSGAPGCQVATGEEGAAGSAAANGGTGSSEIANANAVPAPRGGHFRPPLFL